MPKTSESVGIEGGDHKLRLRLRESPRILSAHKEASGRKGSSFKLCHQKQDTMV